MAGGKRARALAGTVVVALLLAGAGAAIATAAGGLPARGGSGPAADPPSCGNGAQTLTVRGTGLVTTTPDVLRVSFGVHTTASSASGALGADNAAATAVLKALAAGGVAKKDVQTTGLSMQERYASTGTVITGYAVDNTVVAKIRRLSTAGTVIDAAVAAGGDASRINSLSFASLNQRHAQDQARSQAVHQAVAHAKSMAAAAGEHLGAICSLKDDTGTSGTPVRFHYPAAGAVAQPAVPISRGTEQVRAHVTIVYALSQRAAA